MNTTELEAHPTPKAIVYRFFAQALNEASSGGPGARGETKHHS